MSDGSSRLKPAIRRSARAAVTSVTRWSGDAGANSTAVDLLVASLLTPEVAGRLNAPTAFVSSLRGSFRHWSVACRDVGSRPTAETESELRFDTLVETLQDSVPPFSAANALLLSERFDAIAGGRNPFVRPLYATDSAHHAQISSSATDKGRLLAALVRFMTSKRVVDIGTAYGMSALYLTAELSAAGRVVTVELSEPQLSVSRVVLKDEPRIRLVAGASHEVVEDVNQELDGDIDLVCHDGAHNRDAYIADFHAYEPHMAAGSIWFLDDLHWHDPRVENDPRTYEGWQHIIRHPRVRRAIEIDGGRYGLLQMAAKVV